MTEIRCPNCGSMNLLSALQCVECSMPFSSLPSSAFIVSDAEPVYQSSTRGHERPPTYRTDSGQGNSTTGENTFFWYRMYCGSLALFYLLFAALSGVIAYVQPDSRDQSAEETLVVGIIYTVFGVIFFVVFLVATLLPAKPYNWIVGITMIAISMTSCCLWPAAIPLLIYWIKPETRSYFGRI